MAYIRLEHAKVFSVGHYTARDQSVVAGRPVGPPGDWVRSASSILNGLQSPKKPLSRYPRVEDQLKPLAA